LYHLLDLESIASTGITITVTLALALALALGLVIVIEDAPSN